MTDFGISQISKVPRKNLFLWINMYLFFIKIIFLFCMWNLSNSLGLFKDRAEYVKSYRISSLSKNGSSKMTENEQAEFLPEHPVAVIVELKQPLLDKVKAILDQEESEIKFLLKRALLGKVNSQGLEDIPVYNDTSEVPHETSLKPANDKKKNFTPTVHVLGEMLEKNLMEGSVLLIKMSKPLDEEFSQKLKRTLMKEKISLSVIWARNYSSDENAPLKNLEEESKRKLRYLKNENNTENFTENFTENYFPKADFENISEQIKFPEGEKENTNEEKPLVSKTANQKVLQKAVVPLIVEVASGTSLEARPGAMTQVQFNVKNNINVALPVVFNAKFNGIVQNVQPPQALLQPSASVTVIVNLQPLGSPQSVNAVGTLTLLAVAANKVTPRSALIFMTPQATTDNTAPKIYYKYEGDCSNYKEPQNCEHGHWSLEATLQDEESGLLKVLSEPYGLLFQTEFVAGTKSPVTVYYSATCCQPNTVIWAEDLKGNYVKKSFDVFNQNLLAGEIASIVLGVIFIIFIIISVIAAVIIYKKRNQRNLIIPSVRSNSS